MNFCIDGDYGNAINGWLTPDNPGRRPRFILEADNSDPIEFDANVFRQDLMDLGWHSTGQVGFQIDESVLPGIESIADIRLTDYDTGITIYRRIPENAFKPYKLLLYDCSAMPQWRLLSQVGRAFGLTYNSIDRYPLETTLAIIWSHGARSAFANGAPNFLRYSHAIRSREYKIAALLRPPMEELAERLLFLRTLASNPALESIRALFGNYEPLIAFAAQLEIDDRKSLISSFRAVDERARGLMRSPMTRTFGAEVTDAVEPKQVSAALDNLASFDLVGTRSRFEEFQSLFDALFGERLMHGAALSRMPGVADLAAKLSDIGPVLDLIEEDIMLYSYVEGAMSGEEAA